MERLTVDISAIAALAPVVPVLTIERTADAVPLARALVKGGVPVVEITLRPEAALAAPIPRRLARQRRLGGRLVGGAARRRGRRRLGEDRAAGRRSLATQTALALRPERCFNVIVGVRPALMNKLAIAATALALAASGAARADSVLVLNSEDASYSILSRSGRIELVRLPIGREPHHLMPTPDGKDVLVGSTSTNELLMLDAKTGAKHRV